MKAMWMDALRHLRSQRRATAVTVLGLMLAQAACLLVGLFMLALAEPDPSIPNPDEVVLLDFRGNPPGHPSPWFTRSPVAFAEMLKARQVPLDLISRASLGGMDIHIDGRLQPALLMLADPDLVPLLGLQALAGDLRATLGQRDAVAVSTDLARKLWGELPLAQALGQHIQVDGKTYTVTAVVPNADPRSPGAGDANPMVGRSLVIAGFDSQANAMSDEERQAIFLANGRVFARLRPGTSAEQVGGWMQQAFKASPLYAKLPAEWTTGREAAYFRAITLRELPFEGEDKALLWQMLGVVAAASGLLLVLAAFNAMNLQAAGLLQRQRETALRRSLGANGAQLLRLWTLEALLPLLASAAGALLLAWWAAPAVANWLDLPPNQPVADPLPLAALAGLAACVLVLLVLTLALPAWTALRRTPATALQGRTASEGPWGRRVRQGLLGLQLGGALLLLAMAGVMAVQQQHLLHVDRGFDTHNRLWLGVMVNPEQVPDMAPFTAALGQHPAITHWAYSSARPARDTEGVNDLHVSPGGQRQVLRLTTVSPGFFDAWGMTLLAGSPQFSPGERHVVIDAKAARLLGFATPQAAVGSVLLGGGGFLQAGTEQRRVVGVVKDVTMESGRDPAMPQAFLLSDQPQWDLTVYGPDMAALRQAVEDIWKAHGPALLHQTQTADEQRAAVYSQDAQLTTTVAAVSLLAVGVAMLGAYALVADTLRRRRTELILRRLHGAGTAAIARQVTREFAVPLLAAALLVLPLAAWLGWLYLSGFEDSVSLALGLGLPLAGAAAATVLVTALSALRHVRQALALQPIEALG